MKILGYALVVLTGLFGCATGHFETVVRRAVSDRQDCGGEVSVKALGEWGYRIRACERTTYYRCFFKKRTMGRTQCCYPVPDENAATTLISLKTGEETCYEF